MKQINQILTFTKATFKFAFWLLASAFSVAINFLFSDSEDQQKVYDHLSDMPEISWSGQDESSTGMRIVSKDGYMDDL